MQALRWLVVPSIALCVGCSDSGGKYRPAVDDYIVPAYRSLRDATRELDVRAKSFCGAPSQSTLDALRESFGNGMDAWQFVQPIHFGPVVYLTRNHRFELWPDKRGNVARHLRELLAEKDPEALAPERFASGSVAVQGFSALELLLYEPGTTPGSFTGADGAYACQVLLAITGNLARMSAEMLGEWTGGDAAYRQYLADAAEGNAVFESERDVGRQLLNDLRTTLEVVGQHKLDRPLGDDITKARGRRAESWRSERAARNIRENLLGARQLYRLAFAPQLSGTPLEGEIEASFDSALAAADAIPMPLSRAVADADARARVEALRARVGELETLFASRTARALDLPLGFNSLDGD